MAFDDDPGGAELTGELGDLFQYIFDVGVVSFLDRLPVNRPGHVIERVPAIGKEMDHDRVGENLVAFARTVCRSLTGTFVSYSTLDEAYFSSWPSFWMIEKSMTWSNLQWAMTDRADAAIEQIGTLPDSLEIRGIVFVDEELKVLRPVGAVSVTEHGQRIGGGNVVAGGHQLRDLGLLGLLLEPLHGIEYSTSNAFDDGHVIAGKVSASEPDVGDQPVGFLGRHEQAVALDLRQVVDVWRPGDAR